MKQLDRPVEVLCCYAHEDQEFLGELKTHLSPLRRQNVIQVWHDGDISAGALWDQEIKKHLNEAQVILLLISPDFIDSDYCYSTEIQHALERHKRGEVKAIPILLRNISGWEKLPPGDIQLGQLQALPTAAKAVTTWTDRDAAWDDVVGGIERAINELLMRGSVLSVGRDQESAETLDIASQTTPREELLGATLYTLYRGHSEGVRSVTWSPDGKYIASGSDDGTVQVWEALTGRHLLTYRGHKARVCSVAWSPNGKYIASGSWDKTVQAWDAMDGNKRLKYGGWHSARICSVAWSPDGKYIVSGGLDTPQVWHAMAGDKHRMYQGHYKFWSNKGSFVWSMSWSPDDKYIASGDVNGTVHVWNPTTSKHLFTYKGHSKGVRSVSWSPDSNYIASASDDGTVQVWEALTGRHLLTYREHNATVVFSVAWSPNGKYIASGSLDARVWDSMTGSTRLVYHGHSKSVLSVAWSPDGGHIASGSWDTLVQVWDAR